MAQAGQRILIQHREGDHQADEDGQVPAGHPQKRQDHKGGHRDGLHSGGQGAEQLPHPTVTVAEHRQHQRQRQTHKEAQQNMPQRKAHRLPELGLPQELKKAPDRLKRRYQQNRFIHPSGGGFPAKQPEGRRPKGDGALFLSAGSRRRHPAKRHPRTEDSGQRAPSDNRKAAPSFPPLR